MAKVILISLLINLTGVQAALNVTMQRYDPSRLAANTAESVLNQSNVNPGQFGKLWTYPVDGAVFAQPLYVQGLSINGVTKNVLFVATMRDVVYAFDADSSAGPLWVQDLRTGGATAPPASPWINELGSNIGVLGTPVIDTASGSMYLVAQTLEAGSWVYRLHRMSLTSGLDMVPSTVISAVKSGITFDARLHNQRPGLVLVNGHVVICFSARPHDDRPYHGWIMTYNAATLAQKSVFITTTSDNGAGIWGSGGAPPVDAQNNVYFMTGNAFNSTTGYNGNASSTPANPPTNFSESVLKMSVNPVDGSLTLLDWFTAFNWSSMDQLDEDLSCNAPMLIPRTDLIAFGSKTADVYVAHTGSLGHLQNNNSQLAAFFHVGRAVQPQFNDGDRLLGLAYWDGPRGATVFAWPAFDSVHSYSLSGSTFTHTSSNPLSGFGEPGMPISLSANGAQPGTGILWATMFSSSGRAVGQAGEVHAFNAENLQQELWSSVMNKGRDDVGSPGKFVIPVVTNGRLYMASVDAVRVYGILPVSSGGSIQGVGSSSTASTSLTTEGSTDWIHWGDSAINRKAGAPAALSTFTVVGSGAAANYGNDLRPLSWSDGAPTASGAANTNGVFINNIGNGFSFTAPADTAPRTLTVHVGGWNSGGTFIAHLSDNSAVDFSDTTAVTGVQYDRNYTLTYHAATAAQTITVRWTMSSGAGNVTLNGAALSGPSTGTPVTVTTKTLPGGTVGTAYSQTLGAGGGTPPYSGWTVVTGALPPGLALNAATGVISGTPTTATGSPFSFSVTVKDSAGSTSPAQPLSITIAAATSGGSLSGIGNSSLTNASLTTEGSADWIHWGESPLNRKASVGPQLSTFATVGTVAAAIYTNDLRPLSWTDGSPTATSASNMNGVFISNVGNGFSFTAPADTTSRTLTVHVGGWMSAGTLTSHLSDGSAADFTETTPAASGQYDRNYTLTYTAASAGKTITVTWVMASGTGNVTLNGAALK